MPIIQEDPFEQLTPREREVAELVQTGMKNLEISVKLNITETTLRVHLRRITGSSVFRDARTCATSTLCRHAPPLKTLPWLSGNAFRFRSFPRVPLKIQKTFRIGLVPPRNRFDWE